MGEASSRVSVTICHVVSSLNEFLFMLHLLRIGAHPNESEEDRTF